MRKGIPEATVARLPMYLRALHALAESGANGVSSEELASATGVNAAKVRKDLSYLGSYGVRGVGYEIEYLVYQISAALGVTQEWPIIIIGVGNLGHALAGYGGFGSRGFRVCGLVDSDRSRVGEIVAGVPISHIDDLETTIRQTRPSIAVLAVPTSRAQEVCDRVIRTGITSILNFAPIVLQVPSEVDVRKVDLSTELQILAFHEQRKEQSRRLEANPA